MQTMELVDIEDVYPYTDNDVRMNPRDVSSRECRAYIAQLAEQFANNRLNPGQPRVRPILYRDGGIYLIVDGECRYEAMKLAGTRKFYADVFDDLDDAETARREAAKAMVETDCKRALTAEEMSRGVQTMLALDVPDEEAAASARIDAAKVRRVRRAARRLDDAAQDMTLDRLAAIDEMAEAGFDDDALDAMRDCAETEWRDLRSRLENEAAALEAAEEIRAAVEAAGVRVVDAPSEGTTYAAHAGNADEAARVAGEMPEGAECVIHARSYSGGADAYFHRPADGAEDDPAEEAERMRAAELADAGEAGAERRKRWFADRLSDPWRSAPHVHTLLCEELYAEGQAWNRSFGDVVRAFEDAAGIVPQRQLQHALAAYAYETCARGCGEVSERSFWTYDHCAERYVAVSRGTAEAWLSWISAFEADGYAPDEADEDVRRACEAALAEADDED